MRRSKLLAGASALVLGMIAMQSVAEAAVIQVLAPQQFSSTPISFSIGTGTFSFTLDPDVGNGPQSFIQSNAAGAVATIFGSVADFESGASIDGNYHLRRVFDAHLDPELCGGGLLWALLHGDDGTHYGYAEVFGSTFVGYAYQVPGTTITDASGAGAGVGRVAGGGPGDGRGGSTQEAERPARVGGLTPTPARSPCLAGPFLKTLDNVTSRATVGSRHKGEAHG